MRPKPEVLSDEYVRKRRFAWTIYQRIYLVGSLIFLGVAIYSGEILGSTNVVVPLTLCVSFIWGIGSVVCGCRLHDLAEHAKLHELFRRNDNN